MHHDAIPAQAGNHDNALCNYRCGTDRARQKPIMLDLVADAGLRRHDGKSEAPATRLQKF
jgi:hypothetical protein